MNVSNRVGVIDVGSNTIRAAVYEVSAGSFRMVQDRMDFSNLLTQVEQGMLSEPGVQRLCNVLTDMNSFCQALGCRQVDCFATASLRGIQNFPEVARRTKACGVALKLLSGEEEALCDYEGLLWETGAKTGVGMDLGGGSGQLFCFEERVLKAYESFPIGVMAMKRRFSMDCAPGMENREAVRAFVLSQLAGCPGLRAEAPSTLYVMGGTVRAAYRVHCLLHGLSLTDGETEELSRQALEELYSQLPTPQGQAAVLRVEPDRLPTMGSGLIVMMTVCEFLDAPRVTVAHSGVREGYLWKNMIGTTR